MISQRILYCLSTFALASGLCAQNADGSAGPSIVPPQTTTPAVIVNQQAAPVFVQVGKDGFAGGGWQAQTPGKSNKDGTVGNAPSGSDSIQLPVPTGPDGSLSGSNNVMLPQTVTCVSQNPGGGTLTSSVWVQGKWFAHRVVAPFDLKITSFEFFGKTGGNETIQTRIYSATTAGKPNAVLRSSSMNMTTTAKFYPSTVAQLDIAKNTVFFIAYLTPANGNFRTEISAGTLGTYYYDTTWSGPFSRRFAWKVNCSLPGSYTEYGWGCEGLGAGSGTYAAGLNTDATASGSGAWLASKQFVHMITAPRDMSVSGASFLSRMVTGSSTLTTYMYLSVSGKPASSPVRTGSMVVSASSTSTWNNTCWEPYSVKAGQVFFVGYMTPTTTNLRIDTADGDNTSYFWNGPATWSGPFSTYKFGIRIATSPAGGENQFASANAAISTANAQFVHRYVATSDMWLGGFTLLTRMSTGSATLKTYVYRANAATGKPASSPVRTGSMSVTTTSRHNETTFAPVFIAKDEVFYVGALHVSNLQSIASSGIKTTYYWNGPANWNGPFTSQSFSFRLDSYVAANNAASTVNAVTGWTNAQFVHRIVVPKDMWLTGFSSLSSMATGVGNIKTHVYLDSAGKPAAAAVRNGTMTVRTTTKWNETCFAPLFLKKGTVAYCGYTQITGFRPDTTTGSLTTYFWNGPPTWSGPFSTRRFGIKLLGHGASVGRLTHNNVPEVGKTFQVKLNGAKPGGVYGLLFGSVKLATPFLSCHLWTNPVVILNGSVGSTGNVIVALPVPNTPSLMGKKFWNQFYVVESFAPVSIGLTNGGEAVIGG